MKNELRIIGGQWRSRKLRFPAIPGLRPTSDRIRETLFNWLRQDLEGYRCLDLFAGSGALGLEAASRGAPRVVAVERSGEACSALKQNCALLDANHVEVVQQDVARYLMGTPEAFDVAFLDPPFHQDLVAPTCRLLEERGWLAPGARIYIESERHWVPEGLPESWELLKTKTAGEVGYHLFRRPLSQPG
ncbi:16S rRNA (guanine(966)-N(2))-methyltransferase RsmD [Methyloterricola oryzae]|uniref:16S rRNA (guanine(966)-N(2))-methyltransferase RsmD n=1 Tax=Methyloterricola oryzae TaxID=1495050 RepID=UPI0005EB46E6|nr:16S rRNA (guanine(966)-N(2))-methyltransferase RsmD [Methyloterricola oryzae]